ncbi:MAG: hypothetical protein R3Y58_03940 [Eubacteriales bacterium]
MKKCIVIIVTVLICIGIGGCTKEKNQVLTTLEISDAEYTVTCEQDTHGGFHGDGYTFMVIEFEDDISEQIDEKARWLELPLDEVTNMLVYGYEDEERCVYPYTTGENSDETLIPDIEEGYYYFAERVSTEDDEWMFGKIFKNFVVTIYDKQEQKLYYYEFDS